MTDIDQLAESLGRTLGNTPEYRTLARAMKSADDDRTIVELTNELKRREATLQSAIREGKEPDEAAMSRYESILAKLQASSIYQSLVAAQANFDKVMYGVDAAIQRGLRKGVESPIIFPPGR